MAKLDDIKSYIHSLNEQYVTDGSSALAVAVEEPVANENPSIKVDVKNNIEPPPRPTIKNPFFEEKAEKNVTNDRKSDIINNLVFGEDYGIIPKVQGNVLFKKGALKIIKLMGYKHTMTLVDKSVDVANNYLGYTVKVTIVDADGGIVTEAFGSANTLEAKFVGKGFAADSMLIGMASKRALVECAKELILC